MADKGFNKSAVVFAGITVTNQVLSIDASEPAAKVDVSPANATLKTHELGIPDLDVTIEFVGGVTGLFEGQKGGLNVTWNDGVESVGDITNALLYSLQTKGSKDNPITTTAKFCPSTTSGT